MLNVVLYLTEGELGDAALSGISMVPMLGDLFGKGGKGTKYLMKAADVTKLNRNKKVVKVLDSIDIFVKARKSDMGELQNWIWKSLDNLANGGDEVVELAPDGLRSRINGDLRANINLMDETGDILQETVRLGNKAGDGRTVLKAGSGAPLKYKPTSGVSIKATPGKTTTILGTYADDTGNILNERGNTKSMDFGPRDGGFNLLNTPDEIYNQLGPDGFCNQCNKSWLDNAIARNDIIVFATDPTENTLYRINKVTGMKELSGFGREYQYLIDHGYVFDNALKQMIKNSREELNLEL